MYMDRPANPGGPGRHLKAQKEPTEKARSGLRRKKDAQVDHGRDAARRRRPALTAAGRSEHSSPWKGGGPLMARRAVASAAAAPSADAAAARPVAARTRLLLEGPIAPTLLRLAAPNVVVMTV